jgi:hypothetical protein
LKAKENPFRTEQIHRIAYRFLDESWNDLLARLDELDHFGAIVGADGSGKSTLLEELGVRLGEQGFTLKRLFLNDMTPTIPRSSLENLMANLTEKDIILFDGADLMGRLAWSRFERRASKAAGLIVTVHRSGLLPTLIECRTTPGILEEIVSELLDSPDHGLDLVGLFDRHEGDIRAALRELYDTFALDPGSTSPASQPPSRRTS